MTRAQRLHLERVQSLGCIICRRPAEIHHLREGVGKGQKSNHFRVIPLCPEHHRTGGHGVAFHAGKKTWQEIFGTEEKLMEKVNILLEAGI
jgi:hypothetical protein